MQSTKSFCQNLRRDSSRFESHDFCKHSIPLSNAMFLLEKVFAFKHLAVADASLARRIATQALNFRVIEAVPALVHEVRNNLWPVDEVTDDEVTDEAKTGDGVPHLRRLPKDVRCQLQRCLGHPPHQLFRLVVRT